MSDGAVSYVREMTVGEVFRGVFALYFRLFPLLFGTYLIPLVPWIALGAAGWNSNAPALLVLDFLMMSVLGLFAFGGVSLCVSDRCVGNRPSVWRSLRLGGLRAGFRLAGAALMQALILCLAALAVVVGDTLLTWEPKVIDFGTQLLALARAVGLALSIGLVCGLPVILVRCGLAATVVVLERRKAIASLRRSAYLTKDCVWRLVGCGIAVSAMLVVLSDAVGIILVLLHAASGIRADTAWWMTPALKLFGCTLALPFPILSVLMYFDLRARKEGYDAAALSDDLRR
jgi:hypothetical protein